MPRDTRVFHDLLTAVTADSLKDVRTIFETRITRPPSRGLGLTLTCIGDYGNRATLLKDCESVMIPAARLKDPAVLKYLINNNMNVNFVGAPPDLTGSKITLSPLHAAVSGNLTDNVSVLLEANANVSCTDHNGRTALHLAVKRANCECCRLLLARGASTSAPDAEGVTPLQSATRYGHVELVRILLEHDAHVFARGQKGANPLHIAAMEGHVPLIDLFSRYVDINIRASCSTNNEQTALHLAAERGLIETVRFMVERFGAAVDVLDSRHQTALHYTLHRPHDFRRMRRKDDFESVVEYLLKKGVDFHQTNANGDSALHLAAKNQFHRVAELLLIIGADAKVKNKQEKTPQDLIPDFDKAMGQLFVKYSTAEKCSTGSYLFVTSPVSPRLMRVANNSAKIGDTITGSENGPSS